MIFPERVFGSPAVTWMRSGVAMGPMAWRTCSLSAPTSSSASQESASGLQIT